MVGRAESLWERSEFIQRVNSLLTVCLPQGLLLSRACRLSSSSWLAGRRACQPSSKLDSERLKQTATIGLAEAGQDTTEISPIVRKPFVYSSGELQAERVLALAEALGQTHKAKVSRPSQKLAARLIVDGPTKQ